ncbi:MAG: SEL1-like repeat protein, partial [Gammaproteobacteria bacterium]
MKRTIFLPLLLLFVAATAHAATLADAKMAIRTQDFARAVKILYPLSRSGDKEAQYHLAVMHRNGQGTPENAKKAAFWMKKSANQGYKRAQYSL